MQSIFSVLNIPTATCKVYCQCLTSDWPYAKYTLSVWHAIGHIESILVQRVVQHIMQYLSVWHPNGHKQSIFSTCDIPLVTSKGARAEECGGQQHPSAKANRGAAGRTKNRFYGGAYRGAADRVGGTEPGDPAPKGGGGIFLTQRGPMFPQWWLMFPKQGPVSRNVPNVQCPIMFPMSPRTNVPNDDKPLKTLTYQSRSLDNCANKGKGAHDTLRIFFDQWNRIFYDL